MRCVRRALLVVVIPIAIEQRREHPQRIAAALPPWASNNAAQPFHHLDPWCFFLILL